MFSRVKPSGWAFGEILTSAQMNTLDAMLPSALDAVGGGTYANVLIRLSGDFRVDGFTTLAGVSTQALTVNGEAVFQSDVTINTLGNLIVRPATTTFSGGPVTSNAGTLWTFGDTVTMNGPLVANGNVQLGNTSGDAIDAFGIFTLRQPLRFSGNGTLRFRYLAGGDSGTIGSPTLYTANLNWLAFPPLSSANRFAQIDTDDGGSGSFMIVTLDASTVTQTITFPGGAAVTFAGNSAAHGAIFRHNGTTWQGPYFQY